MPAYRILLKASAEKELDALPKADPARVSGRILAPAATPRPSGSRKLEGREGYRIRSGFYRVLYTVDDASATVTVYSVGHRRDVYR